MTIESILGAFDLIPHGAPASSRGDYVSVINAKNFIRAAFNTRNKELREKVEGMKRQCAHGHNTCGTSLPCYGNTSANLVLDQVLDLIKEEV